MLPVEAGFAHSLVSDDVSSRFPFLGGNKPPSIERVPPASAVPRLHQSNCAKINASAITAAPRIQMTTIIAVVSVLRSSVIVAGWLSPLSFASPEPAKRQKAGCDLVNSSSHQLPAKGPRISRLPDTPC